VWGGWWLGLVRKGGTAGKSSQKIQAGGKRRRPAVSERGGGDTPERKEKGGGDRKGMRACG